MATNAATNPASGRVNHFHIIEANGSRYYPLDEDFNKIPRGGKSKADLSFQGQAAARQAIAEDEDLRERILTRLLIDS